MDEGSWHYTGGRDQDHAQEKEMQKGQMAVWGGLMNSWEKKRSERQGRKGPKYKWLHFKGNIEKKIFLYQFTLSCIIQSYYNF